MYSKDWEFFKAKTERNNQVARARLNQQKKENRTLHEWRSAIIGDIRRTIPCEEKEHECVVVSLRELFSVGSLDANDYKVKTQVNIITAELFQCESVEELLSRVRELALRGKVWTGERYLVMRPAIRNILDRYASSAGKGSPRRVAFIG